MNRSHLDGSSNETPLVLLIDSEEWTARSIESILKPEGYAVLLAYTGQQGLELAERTRPHLLLIDLQLPDLEGTDLCERIRRLPSVGHNTPILLFSSGPVSRTRRLAGFRAGAWGFLNHPFDSQELLARFEPLIMAKRSLESAGEQSELDALTGVYSFKGLARRLQEISADTKRSRRPLSCVVVGPSKSGSTKATPALAEAHLGEDLEGREVHHKMTRELGSAIRSVARASDVVARISESDFLIVAPGTNDAGAFRLAERVMEVVAERSAKNVGLQQAELYAGCCAVPGSPTDQAAAPQDFLEKVMEAMEKARHGSARPGGVNRILAFDPN
jgi:PleD family two-component response regulator